MEMNVTFKCGHNGTKRVRGRGGPATTKSLAWWLERDCTDCWKAEKAVEVKELSTELPALEGSEKRVNCAMGLRLATIAKLDEAAVLVPDIRIFAKIAILKLVVSAKFWIDTRGESAALLLGHVMEDGKVTTKWFAKPVRVPSRHSRGYAMVGGTKARYTEHALAEV